MLKKMQIVSILLVSLTAVFVFGGAVSALDVPIVVNEGTLDLSSQSELISNGEIKLEYSDVSGDNTVITATGNGSSLVGTIKAGNNEDILVNFGEGDTSGGIKYDTMWKYSNLLIGISADSGGKVDFANNKVKINAPSIGLHADSNGEIVVGDGSEILAYQRDRGQALVAEGGGRIIIGQDAKLVGTVSDSTKGVVSATGGGSVIEIGAGSVIENDVTYGYDADYWKDIDNQNKYGYGWEYSDTYRQIPKLSSTREYFVLGNDHYVVFASGGASIKIGDGSTIKITVNRNYNLFDSTNKEKQNNMILASGNGTWINIGNSVKMESGSNSSFGVTSSNEALIKIGDYLDLSMSGKSAVGILAYEQGRVEIGKSAKIELTNPDMDNNADYLPVSKYTFYSAGLYAAGVGAVIESTSSSENDDLFIINTKGTKVHGVYVTEGGEIHLNGKTEITVSGTTAAAVYLDKLANNPGNEDFVAKVTIGANSLIKSENYVAIYAQRKGHITVGDNSKIISFNGNTAIFSNQAATVKVGDDVEITSGSNSSYAGVIRALGGNLEIGNRVKISNIDILQNDSNVNGRAIVVDTLTDTESTVTIGKYSEIITTGKGTSSTDGGAHALLLGVYNYGAANGMLSTLTIGENAKISTEGQYSHGLFVNHSTGVATIGNYSNITTSGKDSSAVKVKAGGSVTLENNVELYTNYNLASASKSYGIYATGVDGDKASSVKAGTDLKIETLSRSAHGIYVDSGANTETGDRAKVSVGGSSAYALYVSGNNSVITLGANSKVESAKSNAIYISSGGKVNLGAGTTVTADESSSAMYFASSLASVMPEYTSVSLTGGNAVYNAGYNQELSISFSGESNLKGDLRNTFDGSGIEMMLKGSSKWQGSKANATGTVSLQLHDKSTWVIAKDSSLDNLKMESFQAFIQFLPDENGFRNARVENLSGEGSIEMNVDLQDDVVKGGDMLSIGKASGTYKLVIKSANNLGGASELQLVQIDDASELTAPIKLGNGNAKNRIQIGSCLYELSDKDTNFTQWWLVFLNSDDKIKDGASNFLVGFSEFAKAVDATLSDEIMRTKNDLWIIASYKKQNYDEAFLGTGLTQQIGISTVGIDKDLSDFTSVGALFGLNLGYQEIGEDSLAYISSLTAGAYANYHRGGFTASTYARVGSYQADLRLKGTNSSNDINAAINTYGFNVSLQASYRAFLFGSEVYVEPKGKATYSYLAGGSYDIGGINLDIEASNSVVTWLGMRLGTEKLNEYDKPWGYYLEAGWIHDSAPKVVYKITDVLEEESNTITLGADRFEVGVGFTASPLGKSNFSAELKYAKGAGLVEPIKLQISGSVYY